VNRAVFIALALTGCYRPGSEVSCTVQCNAAQPCEGAMNCELGLCRDPLGPACSDAGVTDGSVIDADPDALIDTPLPADCWGSAPNQFCQTPAPTGTWNVTLRVQINTDNDPRCLTVPGYPYCVIAYVDITIGAPVEAYGSKPLMIVATHDLEITAAGLVDVSANGSLDGAGAAGTACAFGTPGMVGGGGAGGTFAGVGGVGGSSDGPGGLSAATGMTNPPSVRGGCPGSSGGGNGGGIAGGGGGAIVLIAGNSLAVSGPVYARGGQGEGGGMSAGGGGGGSGGLIVLDGQQMNVSSSLIAGGGGGGGGGSSEAAGGSGTVTFINGSPGQGGYPGASTGGTVGAGRGGAGSGALVMVLDGQGGFPGAVGGFGGGGGGGGAGVIRIKGPFANQSATIVPPAT
jgi:hypothetical protein